MNNKGQTLILFVMILPLLFILLYYVIFVKQKLCQISFEKELPIILKGTKQ